MIIPESGGDTHYLIIEVLFLVAEYLGDDAEALDAADGMLDQNTDA